MALFTAVVIITVVFVVALGGNGGGSAGNLSSGVGRCVTQVLRSL